MKLPVDIFDHTKEDRIESLEKVRSLILKYRPNLDIEFHFTRLEPVNPDFQYNKDASDGDPIYTIPDEWLKEHIVSIAKSPIAVASFSDDQWHRERRNAWGGTAHHLVGEVRCISMTSTDGQTEIHNGVELTEFEARLAHELLHILKLMCWQEDTTHDWEDKRALFFGFTTLDVGEIDKLLNPPVTEEIISRDLDDLYPPLREYAEYMLERFVELYPDLPRPFITCTFRNCAAQKRMLREGVSRASCGQSLHNYRPALAFDVAFQKNGRLDWSHHLFQKWGELAEMLDLEWGGRWPNFYDGAHVQIPMTWEDAAAGKIPELPGVQPELKETVGELRQDYRALLWKWIQYLTNKLKSYGK